MTCNTVHSKLADLLFEPEAVPAEIRAHVDACPACREELDSLKATMDMMDVWEAPEPSPYFDSKLAARLREEKAAPPAGVMERFRAWLEYGTNLHLRPVAATALTVLMAVGGATYVGLNWQQHPANNVPASATVRDLQTLDRNAQIFQQLESVDQDTDD
jgi:predicted anti-sigma-YlaC factor YlaD